MIQFELAHVKKTSKVNSKSRSFSLLSWLNCFVHQLKAPDLSRALRVRLHKDLLWSSNVSNSWYFSVADFIPAPMLAKVNNDHFSPHSFLPFSTILSQGSIFLAQSTVWCFELSIAIRKNSWILSTSEKSKLDSSVFFAKSSVINLL